jgi:hypothetical protein
MRRRMVFVPMSMEATRIMKFLRVPGFQGLPAGRGFE